MRQINLNRRHFVASSLALSSGLASLGLSWSASARSPQSESIRLLNVPPQGHYNPLDIVELELPRAGTVKVLDGVGNVYITATVQKSLTVKAGGALGYQHILLLDEHNQLQDVQSFLVDGQTHIQDASGRYGAFLDTLYWSMTTSWSPFRVARIEGKFYEFFSRWLRDHVHTLKGLKYFYPSLKSNKMKRFLSPFK
ncbi:MAG: hypothetical protein F6K30_00210, partial [Cyanothece sp. SIO2G6]|nr:hypothetical protein [Cyanothece sp. SIO2G6]